MTLPAGFNSLAGFKGCSFISYFRLVYFLGFKYLWIQKFLKILVGIRPDLFGFYNQNLRVDEFLRDLLVFVPNSLV